MLKEASIETCSTKNFLLPFEKMIDYQVECMLNPYNKKNNSTVKRELIPKNTYKERNVIFEKEN